MRSRSRQDGYVLLMTLLLVSIVGAAMAAACRQSLAKALQARRAGEDLQRRWGAITCQKTFLSKSEELLQQAAENAPQPVVSVPLELQLGGQTFCLIVGDEQAKANVNALYERRGKIAASQSVTALTAGLDSPVQDLLRPSLPWQRPQEKQEKRSAAAQKTPAMGCLGQVFSDTVGPDQLAGTAPRFCGAAAALTCWGDGRVNFRRARLETLLEACRPDLAAGDIDGLMRLRTGNPGIGLARAMTELKLSKEKQDRAMQLLTDQSSVHSLWIITTAGTRIWYRLAVQDVGEDNSESVWAGPWALFEW